MYANFFIIMPIFYTSLEICAMRSLSSTTPNVLSLIFSHLERYLLWPRFRCGRCQRDFRFNVTMVVPMFCTDCIASIPMPRYTVKYYLKEERNDVGTLPLWFFYLSHNHMSNNNLETQPAILILSLLQYHFLSYYIILRIFSM